MEIIGKYLVYGLVDPRDGQLRYIGKSVTRFGRPRQKHAAHCRNWEIQLEKLNLEKKIVVIHDLGNDCQLSFLRDAEIFWIAYYRKMGVPLTNLTDGGDGTIGFRHSETTKQILRLQKLGKKQTKEFVEKRIAPLRGRKLPSRTLKHRLNFSVSRGTAVMCNNDGMRFHSGIAAAQYYKIPTTSFKRCLKNGTNYSGLSFVYAEAD